MPQSFVGNTDKFGVAPSAPIVYPSNVAIFFPILYRESERREATELDSIQKAYQLYIGNNNLSQPPQIRPISFYDLAAAGSTAGTYFGTASATNDTITWTTNTNTQYGYAGMSVLSITVPQNKVFDFYGLADLNPNSALQAFQIQILQTIYPPVYVLPYINNPQGDGQYVLPVAFRAVGPTVTATITLYGSATSGTEKGIDVLGFVAEQGTQTG